MERKNKRANLTKESFTAFNVGRILDQVYRDLDDAVQALELRIVGETSTLVNRQIRTDIVPVVVGNNVITFNGAPMASTDYVLPKLRVYVSATEEDNPNVVSKSASGFTVYCNLAGVLDYIAVQNA